MKSIAVGLGALSALSLASAGSASALPLLPPSISGYWLDSAGGLHRFVTGLGLVPENVLPGNGAITFYNGNSARDIVSLGDSTGGFVLDNGGALHRFGVGGNAIPAEATNAETFPTVDVAKAAALLPNKTGGYWLDSASGLHPFGVNGNAAPAAASLSYYHGDSAKDLVLTSNTGGYVLDKGGNLHPFSVGPIATNPLPADVTNPQTFGTADVARGLAMLPNNTGGFWLDSAGALHPFAMPTVDPAPANPLPSNIVLSFYRGDDSARGVIMAPDGLGGYVLDSGGALHAFTLGLDPLPVAIATVMQSFGTLDVARGVAAV